jgi:hypothetical protein
MKYQQLNTLVASINAVIGSQETKTQKKLFKIYEKVKTHHEDYQAKVEELRLDNAAVGEKDVLLLDEIPHINVIETTGQKLHEPARNPTVDLTHMQEMP